MRTKQIRAYFNKQQTKLLSSPIHAYSFIYNFLKNNREKGGFVAYTEYYLHMKEQSLYSMIAQYSRIPACYQFTSSVESLFADGIIDLPELKSLKSSIICINTLFRKHYIAHKIIRTFITPAKYWK